MIIDLTAVFAGQMSYADFTSTIQHSDLYVKTDELFTTMESILGQMTDATVLFVPRDPVTADQAESGWSISHVIAHLTATLEEAAASAAMLARGVLVEARLRYETPWQELLSAQMVQARLRESQHICRAFLDAWPDEAHLDLMRTLIPHFGPMNAVGMYVLGFIHAQDHLDQLRETVRQYNITE